MRGWGLGAPYLGEAALVERVIVTYGDILKWRKDWQQLAKAFAEQDYLEFEAAKAGYAQVRRAIEVYMVNLGDWLRHEVGGLVSLKTADLVDKHQGGKPKGLSAAASVRFRVFSQSVKDQVSYGRPEGALEMVKFGSWTQADAETWIKRAFYSTVLDTRNGLSGGKGDEPSNKAADKFFDSLRDLVKEFSGGGKEWDRTDSAKPRTATFMGLNFGNLVGIDERGMAKFFSGMKPSLEKMHRLMPEVFYGPVTFDDHTSRTVELNGRALSIGGTYHIANDEVTLYRNDQPPSDPSLGLVLVHELAHRYYYKFMDGSQRGRWEDFFERLRTHGVTEYSGKNAAEDFAETVMMYVAKVGNMKERDARERLEAILQGRRLGEARRRKR